MTLSIILQRLLKDTGLKEPSPFKIGMITAVFHEGGRHPEAKDMLKRSKIGFSGKTSNALSMSYVRPS